MAPNKKTDAMVARALRGTSGYVYLIGSRRFRWFKIGKSADARIRVSELGILLPFRIEVIAIWKAENHHALERALHGRYADKRINGEWFSLDTADINGLVDLMQIAHSDVADSLSGKFSNIAEDVIPKTYQIDGIGPALSSNGIQKRIDQFRRRIGELEAEVERLKAEKIPLDNDEESCAKLQ